MAGRRHSPPTEIDAATAWAEAVVSARIVSGHFMIAACERHLRDMRDGQRRGLFWRPEEAERALAFFPAVLAVTAGAHVGEPFNLPSYLSFVVGSLFGWRRSDGRRRFRHAWLELGKGQAKSPAMAAIGVYVMGWCGIARSEVYAIAKDRNQANVLFQDAVAMCQAPIPGREPDTLETLGEVVVRGTGKMAWMVEHPASGSFFRALAGDERVNGPRPALVVADEIHEWRTGAAIETWQAAIAKMPGDALMIMGTNTPAAESVVGTEYSDVYQRILRGEDQDDTAFAVIARVDPEDDPMEDESTWVKALPCLGYTFPAENVRNEVIASRSRLAKQLTVKRLYFGIPVGASEYWIDLDAWEGAQGRVDVAEMAGNPCWLSLDLSQKNDLTALGICWRTPDGQLHATVRYWRPRDGSAGLVAAGARDGVPYGEWVAAGLLNAVPGLAIEYDFVAAEVGAIEADHDVQCLAFDPSRINDFIQACGRIGVQTWLSDGTNYGSGLKIVKHSQGKMGMFAKAALWMPRSVQTLEDLILTGGIVIDESPVTKWCSGNAAIEVDASNNRWFVKRRSRGRIDGLVAIAMAVGAATTAPAEPERSIYETRGLLVIGG